MNQSLGIFPCFLASYTPIRTTLDAETCRRRILVCHSGPLTCRSNALFQPGFLFAHLRVAFHQYEKWSITIRYNFLASLPSNTFKANSSNFRNNNMSPPKTVLVVGNVLLSSVPQGNRKPSANGLCNLGANRGIGYQLATRFLGNGYTVYGTVRPETRADPSVAEERLLPHVRCSI